MIGSLPRLSCCHATLPASVQAQRAEGFLLLLQEDNFHLVDNKPAQRKHQGMRRFQPNRFQQRRDPGNARADMQQHQDRQSRKQQQKRPQFFNRNDQRVRAPIPAATSTA